MNCLRGNHFIKQCKSNQRCKKCQKPHHALLHVDVPSDQPPANLNGDANSVTSHAVTGIKTDTLMMTCRVIVAGPGGSTIEARALLDSASSSSFVSERLTQSLRLPRTSHNATISGIAGLSHRSPVQSVASFSILAVNSVAKKFDVTVPRITCDLPHQPINFNMEWNHLTNIDLADPHFGQPGRIDVLLGVDIFVQVLCQGRHTGPPGSPVAFETEFGWVLAGEINSSIHKNHISLHHVCLKSGDDILRQFWEIEQQPLSESNLTPEEKTVMQHFKTNHF